MWPGVHPSLPSQIDPQLMTDVWLLVDQSVGEGRMYLFFFSNGLADINFFYLTNARPMKGKNSSSISQPSLNHISLSFIWEKVGVEEELSCWRACDRLSLHLWLAKDNRLIIPRAPMKGFWWHLHVGSFTNLVPSVPFLLRELLVIFSSFDPAHAFKKTNYPLAGSWGRR